jgi:dTDP-glucose 4,6-dehydratase
MKKKVLIIGSNSFAGSNFVNYLLTSNYSVVGISRSKENDQLNSCYKKNKNISSFRFLKLDLNKNCKKISKFIAIWKPTYILNFAAQGMVNESWKNPIDWYQTNIISQTKLFEDIKNFSFIKKYINFSTPEVFGNNKNKLKENMDFNPSTPYAISRAAFDNHLISSSKYSKFPIIITRTANIYGPHQQFYRVVPKAIISFLYNKVFYLDGSGKSKRSFIYMDDVSEALIKIMLHKNPKNSYHISTKKFITIETLVKKIASLMKIKSNNLIKKKSKDRLGKDYIYKLDSNLIQNDLNWINKTNLDKGLKKTILWIKNDYNKYQPKDMKYHHLK